ncbi:oxidoreductase [Actinomadura cremea]|nr:oxidoreductase [Actinomadura cremea]
MLVVDAFTDRAFAGNPAGVCLLDGEGDPAWMQRVAAEMKHAETAFVRPVDDPGADYELRWFTPLTEVALCGHATLAAAHALFGTGAAEPGVPIRFRTLRSGVLTVGRDGDGTLSMDFPAVPPERAEPPGGLAAALGADLLWTGRNAQNDVLAEVADEATVRALAPDAAALGRVDARGIIVTAPAAQAAGDAGADGTAGYDFVSRFFAPRILPGDGEDPVTGSAHCALGPFWGERLASKKGARDTLTGYQASARGGLVHVALHGDRVVLSGSAVTVLDGTLHV